MLRVAAFALLAISAVPNVVIAQNFDHPESYSRLQIEKKLPPVMDACMKAVQGHQPQITALLQQGYTKAQMSNRGVFFAINSISSVLRKNTPTGLRAVFKGNSKTCVMEMRIPSLLKPVLSEVFSYLKSKGYKIEQINRGSYRAVNKTSRLGVGATLQRSGSTRWATISISPTQY